MEAKKDNLKHVTSKQATNHTIADQPCKQTTIFRGKNEEPFYIFEGKFDNNNHPIKEDK